MAVTDLGMVRPGSTILIPFAAFSSDDPSASVIISDFVLADIGIYKGTSMDERGSTTGVVLLDTDGINIDGATGIHGFSIDLSSNATAGFYAAGSRYYVTVGPITIDAATINFVPATFEIGYPGAILDTTIGTRTSATVLVLDAGPPDDNALNGCPCIVHDVASAVQVAIGYVLDYAGGTKTVTLAADPGIFASTAADNISFFMPSNVRAISEDTTAADNLELMYDGTGYTDDTAPASRSQVDGISGGTGGSVNIAANSDNTISDTIDNAAAVDKTGGLVGIPITGHAYAAGNEVTIASTTNYNGSFDIVSQTTNEIVITASFVSETFGGTETCNSTIQTVAFVGSVSSGTFANTQVLDDVDHVFTDTGDVIDVAYRFTIGGGRSATSVLFTGNVNGNNDEILLKAYDFVGTTWDTIGVIDGSGGSTNRNVEASLLQRHTGTGGDLGNVFIRLDTDTTTPSDLEVALLLVSAVSIGQTVGYQLGAVWADTDDGVFGTESFVNGVADNPCLTLANMITIGSNVGLHRFVLTPESSITFGETHTNELWTGLGWTLALGNQDIGGSHFNGADVTGTGTGTAEIHFDHCEVGTTTLVEAHLDFCDISGTITLSAAATYTFVDCSAAGSGATIDFGSSVGNTTVRVHNYHGALTVKNMGQNGTDVLHFSSPDGKLTLDSTCVAGTVELNGTFDFVNNGSGMTINDDGAILETIGTPVGADMSADIAAVKTDSAAILLDTAEIGVAGAGLTNIDLPNQTMDITGNLSGSVGSVVGHTPQTGDTFALANGASGFVPIKTETALIVADTEDIQTRLPAALSSGRMASDMEAIAGVVAPATQLSLSADTVLNGAASGTPTTTTMVSDIGITVDDQLNGRVIIFADDTTTAALRDQATDITGCTAATNTLTFTALTTTPVSGDTFVIV